MIARSSHEAADGRPLIEVDVVDRDGARLTLQGTAVAYEGTLILDSVNERGQTLSTTFTTASVSGPERGDWVATLELDDTIASVVIHQEEMEEGAEFAEERAAIVAI